MERINWISRCRTLWCFFKKNSLKKSNILEPRQTTKILGVGSSSHIIKFKLLSISGHFWTTQENQTWSIRSRKISSNLGKVFLFDYLKRKDFRADQKNPLITGQTVSATITAWKVSKYGANSGPYFPVFGLNTGIYFVNLHIQFEYRKIRTRNNSVFGHFSHSVCL